MVVEGDNTTVIQAIKWMISTPWKINLIVRDVSHYLNQMSQFTLPHNYREANLTTYWLAKLGHKLASSTMWESPSSTSLKDIMDTDLMQRALVRRDD